MPPSFFLNIELGNDAMQDRLDIAKALRKLAKLLEESNVDSGAIRDDNGNTVGDWEMLKNEY